MTTFLLALATLIAGYFIYGAIVDKLFGPTDRKTPALIHNDGVDYMPLPTWKVFLIQLLNIAGLGPIFGALGGALWGPPYISGSCWAPFLPAASMTISPA